MQASGCAVSEDVAHSRYFGDILARLHTFISNSMRNLQSCRQSCMQSYALADTSSLLHASTFSRRVLAFQSRLVNLPKLRQRVREQRSLGRNVGSSFESGIAAISERRRAPSQPDRKSKSLVCQTASAASILCFLAQLPANAEDLATATDFSKGSFSTESYVVTLGLFLISLPGLWSQIKRAPKASVKRNTFETDGPKKAGQESLDKRARQIFLYFKKYNYEVKETGDTITFQGTYEASKGQAAALVFYVFCGLLSTGLVLSIAVPFGGQNWYWLAALSPLAGVYYWQRGTRNEEFKVKMVTSDDEMTTDILVEGDKEEIERMRDELALWEKGKVKVKGLLEK